MILYNYLGKWEIISFLYNFFYRFFIESLSNYFLITFIIFLIILYNCLNENEDLLFLFSISFGYSYILKIS